MKEKAAKNSPQEQSTPSGSSVFDVVVIGGGPAGMMAAGRAAELGKRVLLVEKNDGLGKKLLITGGGRCNVTNATFDNRELLKRFGSADQFLFSAFSQFDVQQSIHFFESRGMKTKIEKEQRVFPVSNSARSVWEVMTRYIQTAGRDVGGSVETLMNISVDGFITNPENSAITAIKIRPTKGGPSQLDRLVEKMKLEKEPGDRGAAILVARHFILATGGASRPETGSTGDGFIWLKKIGHTVTMPTPSLVPITIQEPWIKRLAGLGMTGIKITVLQGGIKKYEMKRTGPQGIAHSKILFTHVGMSGPSILNISAALRELLVYQNDDGEVILSLDLLPTCDYGILNKKLQENFMKHSNKKFKNALDDLLPSTLTPIIIERSSIDPEKQVNLVSREERLALIQLIKHFTLTVKGLLGFEKAVIASGGLDIREVDSRTMQSRLFPNLSITGDVLDIERPSGGYSLQLCWTSGYVAGSHIK
ncbi:MAG: hypothetical protein RIT04_607 [Candidatus Parcubacteria bacterium]|jgi:predicted flavoprotein YhiN